MAKYKLQLRLARDMMLAIATLLEDDRLTKVGAAKAMRDVVATKMYQAKSIRRAPSKSRPIDAGIRAQIMIIIRDPLLSEQEIANQLGIGTGGRVSEVLHKDARDRAKREVEPELFE